MGITINFPHDPLVLFHPKAWADLFYITNKVKTEVAVFGIVTQTADYQFWVEKVYLPKQRVHLATTEIQPEDLAAFVEELIEQPGGLEEYARMRLWAHSHASMGLTASSQDDRTLEWLASETPEPFIAVRTNHNGEITADILYPNGLKLNGVPCEQELPRYDLSEWDSLIKDRVRTFTHTGKTTAGAQPATRYGRSYGYDWPLTDWRSQLANDALPDDEGELDDQGGYLTYQEWLQEWGFLNKSDALVVNKDEWDAAEAHLRWIWTSSLSAFNDQEEEDVLNVAYSYPDCFDAEVWDDIFGLDEPVNPKERKKKKEKKEKVKP